MIKSTAPPAAATAAVPRARKLLLAGWSLLQVLEQRKIDQKAVAGYLGLQDTTFSNWMVGATELSQVEAILLLFERLPEPARLDLLVRSLRPYPSLWSPALAHDPLAVSRLQSLLREAHGLTLIRGGTDFARSYVLTALGHAASRAGTAQRPVAGIDVHGLDAFVPVPGVEYLNNPASTQELQARVRAVWPPPPTGPVLLLNGLWAALPELRSELMVLAGRRHVIATDDSPATSGRSPRHPGSPRLPIRCLSVLAREDGCLGIEFLRV